MYAIISAISCSIPAAMESIWVKRTTPICKIDSLKPLQKRIDELASRMEIQTPFEVRIGKGIPKSVYQFGTGTFSPTKIVIDQTYFQGRQDFVSETILSLVAREFGRMKNGDVVKKKAASYFTHLACAIGCSMLLPSMNVGAYFLLANTIALFTQHKLFSVCREGKADDEALKYLTKAEKLTFQRNLGLRLSQEGLNEMYSSCMPWYFRLLKKMIPSTQPSTLSRMEKVQKSIDDMPKTWRDYLPWNRNRLLEGAYESQQRTSEFLSMVDNFRKGKKA